MSTEFTRVVGSDVFSAPSLKLIKRAELFERIFNTADVVVALSLLTFPKDRRFFAVTVKYSFVSALAQSFRSSSSSSLYLFFLLDD